MLVAGARDVESIARPGFTDDVSFPCRPWAQATSNYQPSTSNCQGGTPWTRPNAAISADTHGRPMPAGFSVPCAAAGRNGRRWFSYRWHFEGGSQPDLTFRAVESGSVRLVCL